MSDANSQLPMWTIYWSPDDYPDMFVLRPHYVQCGPGATENITPGEAQLFDNLDDARRAVPPGLVRLDRNVEDDKSVVETWV
jgi:hypothetical protein